jgi:polysaccharide export outer membrane protein
MEIDLFDLMQNGNQRLNVAIQPGDVINVPAQLKTFAYVLGAVRSPGAVEINPKVVLTLAGAIARAGGPSRLADLSDIQIKRKDEKGAERIIKANLKDILKGKVPDIPLLPDDLINVPESFF